MFTIIYSTQTGWTGQAICLVRRCWQRASSGGRDKHKGSGPGSRGAPGRGVNFRL